mmetsp:Transcript_79030/g.221588  ORF Transcript_79030/g.221588 Transcript_79030/m.221588 type:complete len:219 (+) Transcript_79030:2-658(+)
MARLAEERRQLQLVLLLVPGVRECFEGGRRAHEGRVREEVRARARRLVDLREEGVKVRLCEPLANAAGGCARSRGRARCRRRRGRCRRGAHRRRRRWCGRGGRRRHGGRRGGRRGGGRRCRRHPRGGRGRQRRRRGRRRRHHGRRRAVGAHRARAHEGGVLAVRDVGGVLTPSAQETVVLARAAALIKRRQGRQHRFKCGACRHALRSGGACRRRRRT